MISVTVRTMVRSSANSATKNFTSTITNSSKPFKTKDDFNLSRKKEFVDRLLDIYLKHGYPKDCSELVIALDGIIEYQWKFCKIVHFFLEEGVADFCQSAVKGVELDYYKPFPSYPQEMPEGGWNEVRLGTRKAQKWSFTNYIHFESPDDLYWDIDYAPCLLAFHFPIEERRSSILVLPNAILPRYDKGTAYVIPFAYKDCRDVYPHDGRPMAEDDPRIDKIKMLLGISLYMDAFPDAVEEMSGGIVKLSKYTGKRKSIKINQVAKHEQRASVSPHWRRGHLRLLVSDRYKDAKGTVVFVRGTFVKGKAYDIKEDA